ncbi:MAG: GTP-binding protein, partial [Pseudomonadota bacterium]
VGKSTLLNALLGRRRAITSPTPGTTRDFIEEALSLGGLPLRLVDTAGLRAAAQGLEAEGMDLTEEKISTCSLALAVVDAGGPATAEDRSLAQRLQGHPHLVVLNKADLPQRLSVLEARSLFPEASRVLSLSALSGEGLQTLRDCLAELLAPAPLPAVAPNLRHRASLLSAREALLRALDALERNLPVEVWVFELRLALNAVGEICGQTATEEILDRIFSRFCIGK